VVAFALTSPANAGPEWVDRGLTMRQFGVSIDAGLGIAHSAYLDASSGGLNLEAAFSILDNLEIGLRGGVRFGDANSKPIQADGYARLFDLETYGTGGDVFANPEFRVLGRVLDLSVFELGVEGRIVLPFEAFTRFSFMLGLPMRLHIARILRVDTGVYVPVIFYENGTGGPTTNAISANIPAEFWFQVTREFFLGPIAELRINGDDGPLAHDQATGLLFGFGLGYQISRFADFKTSFYFPRINGTPGPDVAAGVGIGLHFD
jgi:hypothetical protein